MIDTSNKIRMWRKMNDSLNHELKLDEEMSKYFKAKEKGFNYRPRVIVGKKYRMKYPELYQLTNPKAKEWTHPNHRSLSKKSQKEAAEKEKAWLAKEERKRKDAIKQDIEFVKAGAKLAKDIVKAKADHIKKVNPSSDKTLLKDISSFQQQEIDKKAQEDIELIKKGKLSFKPKLDKKNDRRK